jgi:hypothetical protein
LPGIRSRHAPDPIAIAAMNSPPLRKLDVAALQRPADGAQR